jgi:hypothetical protein
MLTLREAVLRRKLGRKFEPQADALGRLAPDLGDAQTVEAWIHSPPAFRSA